VADEVGEVVVVDQLRVAEDARFLAEEFLDALAVKFDLGAEFFAGVEEGEGVVIGFVEELDAAGLVQFMETVEDFGSGFGELFEGDAGDREGDAEAAVVLPDVVQKHPIGGEVALLSDLFDQLGVLEVVEIMLICVEDAVPSESEGLVDLEVKADCGHVFGVLSSVVAHCTGAG
jgi:hypothetical protein